MFQRQNNWRQVHWLTRKVAADHNDKESDFEDLVKKLSHEWVATQKEWDAELDGENVSWTDAVREEEGRRF